MTLIVLLSVSNIQRFFKSRIHSKFNVIILLVKLWNWEDGGSIGGSGVHFPSMPVKYLADLRSRANSQQYSSIYEDQRPKIDDIERSDGKKSA